MLERVAGGKEKEGLVVHVVVGLAQVKWSGLRISTRAVGHKDARDHKEQPFPNVPKGLNRVAEGEVEGAALSSTRAKLSGSLWLGFIQSRSSATKLRRSICFGPKPASEVSVDKCLESGNDCTCRTSLVPCASPCDQDMEG